MRATLEIWQRGDVRGERLPRGERLRTAARLVENLSTLRHPRIGPRRGNAHHIHTQERVIELARGDLHLPRLQDQRRHRAELRNAGGEHAHRLLRMAAQRERLRGFLKMIRLGIRRRRQRRAIIRETLLTPADQRQRTRTIDQRHRIPRLLLQKTSERIERLLRPLRPEMDSPAHEIHRKSPRREFLGTRERLHRRHPVLVLAVRIRELEVQRCVVGRLRDVVGQLHHPLINRPVTPCRRQAEREDGACGDEAKCVAEFGE